MRFSGVLLTIGVAGLVCAPRALAGGDSSDAGVIGSHDTRGIPADPMPLVERGRWVFDLRWDKGDVWLLGVRLMVLPRAQPTPRSMGRFALELYEGPDLIERVRFDFPLLAVPEEPGGDWQRPPSVTERLRTRTGVVFPATGRGVRLELWDRLTNRRWWLPWPPLGYEVKKPNADAG